MEDRSQGPLVDCKSAVKSDSERAKDAVLKGTGPSSKTLVKHPDLRIVLLAMRKKTCMHEHKDGGKNLRGRRIGSCSPIGTLNGVLKAG
jgi:hypothetical protein